MTPHSKTKNPSRDPSDFNVVVGLIFMLLLVVPLYWMLTIEVRDARNSILFWSTYGIAALYQTEVRVWDRAHLCFVFIMVALVGVAVP